MEHIEYPLFTVIIPQKNRAEYLIHTLRTCMIQDYPNFEVIVSDDCSDDNSVEVIKEAIKKDPRIKLFAHDHHIGMRDNFEFALNQVRPGYVMALGGDDGLVVGAISKMNTIIQKTGLELLTWPFAGYSYGDEKGLHIRHRKYNGIERIKSEDFLNKIASNFYYLTMDCPMFYVKGVASTRLVDVVKSRTPDGCFYHCPTPDGFSGVVLAGEVEEYAYTEEPLSINGSTEKSQGVNYTRSDKNSRFEAEQFFNDNVRRTMHSQLASQQYSPLLQLMTVDYLLSAKDIPGWPGKFVNIDYKALIRSCFFSMSNDFYAKEVLPRELDIVKEIAKQHNLLDFYFQLLKNSKQKIKKHEFKRYPICTPNVLVFNADDLEINNIYDACLVVPTLYKLIQSSIRGKNKLSKLFYNTIKTKWSTINCNRIRLQNKNDN